MNRGELRAYVNNPVNSRSEDSLRAFILHLRIRDTVELPSLEQKEYKGDAGYDKHRSRRGCVGPLRLRDRPHDIRQILGMRPIYHSEQGPPRDAITPRRRPFSFA
jgi:hypothetical protein